MKKVLFILIIVICSNLSFAQTKKSSSKPNVTSNAVRALKSSVKRGQLIYNAQCIACHQADAGGVPSLNPPLIKTSYVLGDKKRLINILLKGLQAETIDGEEYANVMPPFSHLTNQQIADILTFIRNSFGNKASQVTLADVISVRKQK